MTHASAERPLFLHGFALVLPSAIVACGAAWLMAHMAMFGRNIPQPYIISDYVQGFSWACLLWVLIALLPIRERSALLILWPIKVICALGVMLVYEQHYGLDAYEYYATGSSFNPSAFPVKFSSGTGNMYWLSSIVGSITGQSYHGMKIAFCFIGLLGCVLFYRAASHYLRAAHIWILYAFVLTPTILFWSSIIGKDPIIFFGVGLYALGVSGWLRTNRCRYSLPTIAGMLIAGFLREWYVLIMLPPATIVFGTYLKNRAHRIATAATGAAFTISSAIFLWKSAFGGSFAIATSIATRLVEGFATGQGSGLHILALTSPRTVIEFWPLGVFTALFRPLPWDIRNGFMAAASIEGSALLLLALMALRHSRSLVLRDPVTLWALGYVLCWSAFYGFISYGNLGAAYRFRLEVMPILLLLLLLLGTAKGRSSLAAQAQPRS